MSILACTLALCCAAPQSDPQLAADLAQIGHRDRAEAAAACARVFARGEAALPSLLERWAERPTGPAEDTGRPSFPAEPSPFELLLDPAAAVPPRTGSMLEATDLATPIRITDLPLQTVDETVAALIALAAPESMDVTGALLEALGEDRRSADDHHGRRTLTHGSLVPPLARTCAVLLRHYPNLDRDAVLRAARDGCWPAGAVLLALEDEGTELLRSRPHLVTNGYLAKAGDPRDAARMASGLGDEFTTRLVATWFAQADDDALEPVVAACQRAHAPEQPIAFAILASRSNRSAVCRAHLLALTGEDFDITRTQAWMALGAGELGEDRDAVATAIAAALARDSEFENDETRAAWCAGIALGCLDDAAALPGWRTLLGSKQSTDASWAAVAAAARGALPPAAAWTEGPEGSETERAAMDESSDLWSQIARGPTTRRIAACRAAAALHPDRLAAAVLCEHAIRMQPDFAADDVWNSAVGLGGRAGGRLPFDTEGALEQLRDASPEVRAEAASRLARRVDTLSASDLESLGRALADEAALVRRRLLEGLAAGDPGNQLPFIDAVIGAGRDEDARVRAAAMAAIWRHAEGERAAVDALTAGVDDIDPRVRAAASRIAFFADVQAVLRKDGVLDAMLGDHDAEVLLEVAEGLATSERRCDAAREAAAWVLLTRPGQPIWLRERAMSKLGFHLIRFRGRFDDASAAVLADALAELADDRGLSEGTRDLARSTRLRLTDDELRIGLDRIDSAIADGYFDAATFGW